MRNVALLSALIVGGVALQASATVLVGPAQEIADVYELIGDAEVKNVVDHQLGATATAILPDVRSETTANYSVIGDSAVFSVTFDQARNGAGNAIGETQFYFIPDVNENYVISGNYTISGGYGNCVTFLFDWSVGTDFFYYVQSGTDAFNFVTDHGFGSTSGTLSASHLYQLYVYAAMDDVDPDSTASAGGHTLLTLTPVPEPSSFILAAFGFAGLLAWRLRRRLS